MGQKLNWGAALSNLSEALRTYAMLEQRKKDKADEEKLRKERTAEDRDWQVRQNSEERRLRLQDQLALEDRRRGQRVGEVPIFGPAGGASAGTGIMRGMPNIDARQMPVYDEDLSGTGSLLGRKFAQMQGWGGAASEQTYPFKVGGIDVPLDAEAFASRALQRELDNGPTGPRSNLPSGARVGLEVKRALGGDWRNAELLGLSDDILVDAEEAVNSGVPLQQAIAQAAQRSLGTIDEQRMADLSRQLSSLLPSRMVNEKGKEFNRSVWAKTAPEKKKWRPDKPAMETMAPFDEALRDYQEFRRAWADVIRNGKVTPREIAELRERFNLTDDEFHKLIAIHSEAQGPQNSGLDDFIPPGGK